jgi:hypothetical protein
MNKKHRALFVKTRLTHLRTTIRIHGTEFYLLNYESKNDKDAFFRPQNRRKCGRFDINHRTYLKYVDKKLSSKLSERNNQN